MKIPHQIITQEHYKTENEFNVILLLAFLHHSKKINDDSLKAMFKSLREGKLLRRINTYHCRINNRWYNDEAMYSVLLNAYQEVCPLYNMELNDFLKYLNLYLNKNKNFCIDTLYFNYVEPFLNDFDQYYSKQIIEAFEVKLNFELWTYEKLEAHEMLGDGYCCEDCDGDYEMYKQNRYQYYYRDEAKRKLESVFKKFLLSQKTESHLKNPNERLL